MDLWDKLLLMLADRVGGYGRAAALLGCVVALLMVLGYRWALEERERKQAGRRVDRWK